MTNKMLVTSTCTVLRYEEFEAHREFTMKTMLHLITFSIRTEPNHKELVIFNQLLSHNMLVQKNKVTKSVHYYNHAHIVNKHFKTGHY